MADQDLYEIQQANEQTAKASHVIYVMDPDEATQADQDAATTFNSLINGIVTKDNEIVVYQGNVVFGGQL